LAGFCAFYKHFSGFGLFLLSNIFSTRPPTTNANRWAGACSKSFAQFPKLSCLSNWRLSLANQGSGFSKVSGSPKLAFLAVAIFQVFRSQKSAFVFFSQSFIFGFVRFL
jgi:hypothetical protein